MEEILTCPKCHQPIEIGSYFCPNCGEKIRSKPLVTSWQGQIWLYLKTLLLPPFGFYWGYKYLRQGDKRSKWIGVVVIGLTIVEMIWLVITTVNAVNVASQQVTQQLNLEGL
jgi:hypothetical protein